MSASHKIVIIHIVSMINAPTKLCPQIIKIKLTNLVWARGFISHASVSQTVESCVKSWNVILFKLCNINSCFFSPGTMWHMCDVPWLRFCCCNTAAGQNSGEVTLSTEFTGRSDRDATCVARLRRLRRWRGLLRRLIKKILIVNLHLIYVYNNYMIYLQHLQCCRFICFIYFKALYCALRAVCLGPSWRQCCHIIYQISIIYDSE